MKTWKRLNVLLVLLPTGLLATDSKSSGDENKAPLIEKSATSYITDSTPEWFSLSGEFRFRVESKQNMGYQDENDDTWGLARTRVNIGIKPTSWLQAVFEGQDSRAPEIRDSATNNGVFRDGFDLRQAYLKIGGKASSVTVGRQMLFYGDQRLVGSLGWTNTSRVFDAVKFEMEATNVKLDFFSASVVQNDPNRRINQSAEGNNLHGFYGVMKKLIPGSTVEPYVLWKTTPLVMNELNLRGDLDRYTGGVRIWATGLGPLDYNFAFVKQWGSMAGAEIGAWGSYAELGYTFDGPWEPRLYTEYTFGSGDQDATDGKIGGFVDLFPTAHGLYGFNDLVGWRNLKNIRVGAQLTPTPKIGLRFDYHSFWLANKNDGLYNVSGSPSVAAPLGGATDTSVGDEVNAAITIPLNSVLTLGAGIGHMFPGPFVKANSQGNSNTFTFLFFSYKF